MSDKGKYDGHQCGPLQHGALCEKTLAVQHYFAGNAVCGGG